VSHDQVLWEKVTCKSESFIVCPFPPPLNIVHSGQRGVGGGGGGQDKKLEIIDEHVCSPAHLLSCSPAHLLTCSPAHLLTCPPANLSPVHCTAPCSFLLNSQKVQHNVSMRSKKNMLNFFLIPSTVSFVTCSPGPSSFCRNAADSLEAAPLNP
jgi:hypothetical protein